MAGGAADVLAVAHVPVEELEPGLRPVGQARRVGGRPGSVDRDDKEALRAVARTTGGRFFEAASADQLRAVFEDLGRKSGSIREQREVTDLVVGAALIAAIGAAIGSLAWFSRLP